MGLSWALACSITLLSACASNKPPPDQIFLMPAPVVYTEGQIDPFSENRAVIQSSQPCVLFATDRAPTQDAEQFAYYSDERGNALRLGEACTQLGADSPISWAEARRISLLKNRGDKYPLKLISIDEYGVLERTVPPFTADIERSPIPGKRFAAAIDERLAASTAKDIYIYVHGYKVEFENPVLVASELWNFLGYNGAFIAFSWPATRKTLAYWSDLDDAANSARGLRMLITYLAAHTDAETIHVIGYSAGTQLVARTLADLGMYGRFIDEAEIRRRAKLGNVILVGSDVDRHVLGGYILDGALRVPQALTVYQSSGDSALELSRRVFRRDRAGQSIATDSSGDASKAFLRQNPKLRVIDVSNAESGTAGSGHGYLRGSPWVSSDVLLTLLYDLEPEKRGLVRVPDSPVWVFPDDYIARLRRALMEVDPSLAAR
jgi:esterase/lipase superfamily enzyme